jgi:hypothetical protein
MISYEIIEAVENERAAKPSRAGKYPVPRMLEDLTMRCLHKDPGKRPTMNEFVRILQEDWTDELSGGRR